MGDDFYRSEDPTNSIKVLKEHTEYIINRKNTITKIQASEMLGNENSTTETSQKVELRTVKFQQLNQINASNINTEKITAVCTSERLFEIWFCGSFNRLHSRHVQCSVLAIYHCHQTRRLQLTTPSTHGHSHLRKAINNSNCTKM